MIETVAGVSFWVACNIVYYCAFLTLLAKNRQEVAARIVAVVGLLLGPLLLLLPLVQLLFAIPLCTLYCIHGLVLPTRLPTRSILLALTTTLAGIVAMAWVIVWLS